MRVRTLVLTMAWSLAILASESLPAPAADPEVGVTRMLIPASRGERPLDVTVWYPAGPGGEPVVLGESPFFLGTPADRDAPIAAGRYPLILLSHGAGLTGQAEALGWIAAPLTQRGFVVAAPTHPGNGGSNRSAAETMKLWLRPSDISRTLDAVLAAGLFAPHLDTAQVGVLGLSMGGSTALALAGARLDPKRLAAYCDLPVRNPSLCGWVRQSGVDLHAMDMKAAGQDRRDVRIRFAMAIDPAPIDVFDTASFRAIGIPVDLVNLGRAQDIPTSVQASPVASAIPDASYAVIDDAGHFSMFGLCKPSAAEAAIDAGIQEPICSDGAGTSRLAIHADLVDRVEAAFHRRLDVAAP